MSYIGNMNDCIQDFWRELEDGGDCLRKLGAIYRLRNKMCSRAKELREKIANWAVEYEHWIALNVCQAHLTELYGIRDGIIWLERFEDDLARSNEWRAVLMEMQAAS